MWAPRQVYFSSRMKTARFKNRYTWYIMKCFTHFRLEPLLLNKNVLSDMIFNADEIQEIGQRKESRLCFTIRKKNNGCYYGFKKPLGMFQTPFLSSGLDIVPINLGNHCIFPLYCKSNFGARLCESKSHPQKKYQFTPKQCKCHFVNKAYRKSHLKNHVAEALIKMKDYFWAVFSLEKN